MATILARLSSGAVVTRATLADLPALVNLLANDPLGKTRETPSVGGAGGAGTVSDTYVSAFRAIDADPGQLLVAVRPGSSEGQQDKVIGTLQLSFIPGLSHSGMLRAQIEAVRIADAYRGHGLGNELFNWAIGYA